MRVQFSHGNGFPAGTYRQFLAALRDRDPTLDIHAVERIGHDPRYPITDRWPHLVDELLQAIDAASPPDERVLLIGHSLGGFLSLMAAYRLGARAAGVLLLDAPIVPSWKAMLFVLAKRTGLDERWSPAGGARRRRISWPDRDAAFDHFRDKTAFAEFESGVLRDYVEAGVFDEGDGASLAFEREREYRIYRTLPHHLHRLTRRAAPCPIGFIGGTRSNELRLTGARATRRVVGKHFSLIDGGHLFPLERPAAAADAAHRMLREMGVLA